MSIEKIFKNYIETNCKNCINEKECKEELRIRLDGTIKCNEYKPKIVGVLIKAMRIGD